MKPHHVSLMMMSQKPMLRNIFFTVIVIGATLLGLYAQDNKLVPQMPILEEWSYKDKPSLRMEVVPRYPDGIRVRINFKNFKISEICTTDEAKKPVGHVHLYLNNMLYSMVFQREIDIPLKDMKKGENILLLTMQNPTHKFVTVEGDVIYKRMIVKRDAQEFSLKSGEITKKDLSNILTSGIKPY